MISLQNIVISGAKASWCWWDQNFWLRWPGHKALFFIRISMFCGLVIFIKNFDPINVRRPWAPEMTMFCSEFIMTKTFKPIKIQRPWLPVWFHIFFNKACLVLGCSFLHLGCFGQVMILQQHISTKICKIIGHPCTISQGKRLPTYLIK